MTSKRLKRKPKQARSEETVTVILEAAAQVLLERDYGSATTNRIAERGGISVGSIYQYFRNKEEIFQGVLDRNVLATLNAIEHLDLSQTESIEQAVQKLAMVFQQTWPNGPELLRKLSQAPGLHFREALDRAKQYVLLFVQQYLDERNIRPPVRDLEISLKLLVDAAEGAFINRSEDLQPERFASEIAGLVVGYLKIE